jgi:uncharacterized repeat protein (TIGR01451 family)/CSLREA domain-containing protein
MRRSSGLGAAVCALFFLFVLAPSAGAATFVVNTTDDLDPDGCTTAANGCTLREAFEDANASPGDDVVTLPAGHYRITHQQLGALRVDDMTQGNLELNGAGATSTIIDAEGLSGVIEVLLGSSFDVSGVTVTGGALCGCATGGGIAAEPDTSVTVSDSRLTKNSSIVGGGISSFGGDVLLSNVEVDHNLSIILGGGVAVEGGSLIVEDSYIHDNNTIAGSGGGIYSAAASECPPSECPESSGAALKGDPNPGLGGEFSVSNTTISDNSAAGDGGGIYFDAGTGEEMPPDSLSLRAEGDVPPGVLTNSTVSGNTTLGGGGGAVWVNDGSFDIASSTITGNQAFDDSPGGVFTAANPNEGNATSFKNTILSDNRAFGEVVNCDSQFFAALVDRGGNLEDETDCGFELEASNLDPKLGPLAGNGGPTPTHALRDDSPAIEGGVNDGAPSFDQRGGDRPPADGSAGATVDSGAYEAYSLADLSVEAKADGPDPVTVGGRLTYTIVIRNNGPDQVNGVTMADAVPAGVNRTEVGGVTGGGTCSSTFVCEWQQLAAGAVATATFHTTPTVAGIATNSANIGAVGITDPVPGNNSASAATQIVPAGTVPPAVAPSGERELDDSISVDLKAPKTVDLETFFKGITVTSSCTDELCIRKFREHASINTGATHIAGFNLTVSRTSLGYTAKKKVRLRPCLSGSTTGRRHRRCMKNLRAAAEKAAPFRVKIVVEAVDRAGNRDAKKVFLRVTP